MSHNTLQPHHTPELHPLVKAAWQFKPQCQKLASQHEQQRRVDPSLVKDLAKAGIFRMLVPREYGGEEVPPWIFVEVLEALAQGDGATAWCAMTGSTSGVLSAYMQEQGAQELWGSQPNGVMAGIFAPMGKATPVEGGYQLTGRWPFASGCENSTWCMGGAFVWEKDGPRKAPNGAPIIYSMFFPKEQANVMDTWSVSGLRGTGSHDISVEDLFVPEHHTTTLVGQRPQKSGTLYNFPPFGLLATGVAAVGLGIARASIDALIDLAGKKKAFGSRRTLAQQELTQLQVAQAEAELQAARSFVVTTLSDVWTRAEQNGAIETSDKARVRMAANHAAAASARVVDSMYHLGGGASIYQTSPLQRYFRDIHTMTQHVMISPKIMVTVGKTLLDVEVNTAQL